MIGAKSSFQRGYGQNLLSKRVTGELEKPRKYPGLLSDFYTYYNGLDETDTPTSGWKDLVYFD
jgi:hypothetical protein